MRFRYLPLVLLSLSPLAAAQTDRVVPEVLRDVEGSMLNTYPLSFQDVRWQYLVDGGALATKQALIGGMSFRADGTASNPANTLSLKVDVYTVTTTPASMTTTFASNIGTATATTVFSGKLNVKAFNAQAPTPAPFNVTVPFTALYTFLPANGHLLVDWVENQSYLSSSWRADSFFYEGAWGRGWSTEVWEDTACTNARGDQATLSISTSGTGFLGGAIVVNHKLAPATGGKLDLALQWIGGSNKLYGPIQLPLSLAGLGLKNCALATDIAFITATTGASVTWGVPTDSSLQWKPVFIQGAALDSSTMDLVTTTNAYQVVLLPSTPAVGPAQTVYKTKWSTTTTGTGAMSPTGHFAPVVRFDGKLFQ
ncbi:MAG: hypothetical protein R3F30_06835 [Planctomycetota bacterium]